MDKKNLSMHSCQFSVKEIGGQWYQHRNHLIHILKNVLKQILKFKSYIIKCVTV